MNLDLVLTVIGDDRPGLVENLAGTISAHQGNWLESSMSHLAGKFAGIVRVSVPSERQEALRTALSAQTALKVVAEIAPAAEGLATTRHRAFSLNLVGHDRIGIVREVTQVLARHAVNVESLDTYTSAAPMSGETLFHADATLRAADTLDANVLKQELEALSAELVVDIALDEHAV